jgi:hypothetical protein
MHVHKGTCHDQAEVKMMGQKHGPCQELRDHVKDVVAASGMNIRKLIDLEIVYRSTLSMSEHNQLQDRIKELGEWLRSHGLPSPLWTDKAASSGT